MSGCSDLNCYTVRVVPIRQPQWKPPSRLSALIFRCRILCCHHGNLDGDVFGLSDFCSKPLAAQSVVWPPYSHAVSGSQVKPLPYVAPPPHCLGFIPAPQSGGNFSLPGIFQRLTQQEVAGNSHTMAVHMNPRKLSYSRLCIWFFLCGVYAPPVKTKSVPHLRNTHTPHVNAPRRLNYSSPGLCGIHISFRVRVLTAGFEYI